MTLIRHSLLHADFRDTGTVTSRTTSIKAILVSGYVDDPVIENYSDYGFRGTLKKPFKQEDIKRLMERILNPKG